MLDAQSKISNLTELNSYIEDLWEKPRLRFLFLELTLRCNENCIHCGSRCGETISEELSLDTYKLFLDRLKQDFGTKDKMLCITGGEPLLRKDFFEIVSYANNLGFSWGMTSNATLIDEDCAHRLRETGMRTISISIDGLPKTHDEFRRSPGGYERAMRGLNILIKEGGFKSIQVTTVVTHKSIKELDALYEIFNKTDINSWRVIGIEPIGRAKEHPDLMLTPEDQKYLFEFIRIKRISGEPVTYGCSHYLGLEYEREVRDGYFHCMAGTYTASITTSGDIIACLDIDRRPEFVQGNILRDEFYDVWNTKFKCFRKNMCEENDKCKTCSEKRFCRGGSYHSWNFAENRQEICFKNILF
jgi:radical SAM protein with 4Fe4S-binding SPASM domain